MNKDDQDRWKDEILHHVFAAIAGSEPLRRALIFKGARILARYLGENRQSLDIDTNLDTEFCHENSNLSAQKRYLEDHLPRALRRYFESQNPVRFSLESVKVQQNLHHRHPRGWDAFLVKIAVKDHQRPGVHGLPVLRIDVAAPEKFGPDALTEIELSPGLQIRAYSLHRIAGEKLRAFLTSLPAYRNRMGGGMREHRVKDLHDVARIVRVELVPGISFWRKAAAEFRFACEARLVNCSGWDSFAEGWAATREQYEQDRTLTGVAFSEAGAAVRDVIGYFEAIGIFPLNFPE